MIVDKQITLDVRPGAEICGNDVWTRWERSGGYLVEGPLPTFTAHGRCSTGERRCLWLEHVFFDGVPLEQVTSDPVNGQFAVDANRGVVLADDPADHTVKVTTRTG